jgi:uncharacterized protein YrrD
VQEFDRREVASMIIESVSDIKNIPVVSVKEGAILGLVSRVYIDPEQLRLSGIAFKKKTLGTRMYVHADHIDLFGRDAVLIDADAHVINDGEVPERFRQRFKDLRKTDVATSKGDVIGAVKDLEIRAKDGAIVRIELTDGRVIDLGKMTVSIGRDHVVVKEEQLELLESPSATGDGLFSRLFHPEES